ncbi:RNA-directed DNA polymerase from mobile element jockey [Trichonephila clavipes]|nr:RNA-directed DNA polymerase from mobile element jockey [Trichonephila clavipes]
MGKARMLSSKRIVINSIAPTPKASLVSRQFAKTESAITVQRAFRIKVGCQPPYNNNIIRWYHQLETTGCLCKGKNTASPVAQDNQGRVRGLGRGPRLTNVLRFPTSKSVSLNILQCNINGLSSPATRTKLDQLIELADECGAQIITLQETKPGKHTSIKLKNVSIYRVDRPQGGGGDAIFLGDLNAKHRSWGCTASNTKVYDLLNAADDEALIFLNDGSPTHMSFSYGTSEALDVFLVSPGLFPHCDWTVLDSIVSDLLPILIKIHIKSRTVAASRNFWNFKKANWENFCQLTKRTLGPRTLSDDLEQKWYTFKHAIINASCKSIPRGNFW